MRLPLSFPWDQFQGVTLPIKVKFQCWLACQDSLPYGSVDMERYVTMGIAQCVSMIQKPFMRLFIVLLIEQYGMSSIQWFGSLSSGLHKFIYQLSKAFDELPIHYVLTVIMGAWVNG